MSEKPLSEAIGIDQSAVEALARAGVRTRQELASADSESLAMASGIPLDRIRDWQQRAQRAGAPKKRNPVLTGWMVAIIGILLAALLGWALMSVGAGRIARAEEVRAEAELRLQSALTPVTEEAYTQAQVVDRALRRDNWGDASRELSRLDRLADLMEQISPQEKQRTVAQLRSSLEELHSAFDKRSDKARDVLDSIMLSLDELREEAAQ
jgi:hypothetical protein